MTAQFTQQTIITNYIEAYNNFDVAGMTRDLREDDYQGVLVQELPNGLKAGDTLQLKGKSIFTFADSKAVKLQDES